MWLYGNNYGSTLNALFFISIICDWNFVNTNFFVHFHFQIRGQENIIFL